MDDELFDPVLLCGRLLLSVSTAVALPIGFDGLIMANPIETLFLGLGALLAVASMLLDPGRPWTRRVAAVAAVLAALAWLWLPLKADTIDLLSLMPVWGAAAGCVITGRALFRSAAPPEESGAGDHPAPATREREGWIEELAG